MQCSLRWNPFGRFVAVKHIYFPKINRETSSLHFLSSYSVTWYGLAFPRLCRLLHVGNYSTKITPGQSILVRYTTTSSAFAARDTFEDGSQCHYYFGHCFLTRQLLWLCPPTRKLYLNNVKALAFGFIQGIPPRSPGWRGDGIWQFLHLFKVGWRRIWYQFAVIKWQPDMQSFFHFSK